MLAFLPDLVSRLATMKEKEPASGDDSEAIDHLSLFLHHLQDEYEETLTEIGNLLEHHEMQFDLMWAILVPRTIFYVPCPHSGEPRAARLIRFDLVKPPCEPRFWQLKLEYVEWFGANAENSRHMLHFGFANLQHVKITDFKGTMKIRRLSAYPLVYHQNVKELKAMLLSRGRTWCELQSVHHRQYEGIAVDQGQPQQFHPDMMMPIPRKRYVSP